jgi:hypothetical protein
VILFEGAPAPRQANDYPQTEQFLPKSLILGSWNGRHGHVEPDSGERRHWLNAALGSPEGVTGRLGTFRANARLCTLIRRDLQNGCAGFGANVSEALRDLAAQLEQRDIAMWMPQQAKQHIEGGVLQVSLS